MPGDKLVEEYREAAAQEQRDRNLAIICATQTVCGFEFRQMTLGDYVAFRMVGSPFIVGGDVKMSDVFAFVWRLSPRYPEPSARRDLEKRFRQFQIPRAPMICLPLSMIRWYARVNKSVKLLGDLTDGIRAFVNDSLMDFPRSSSDLPRKSYYSEIVSVCAMIGREYGWTQGYTLSLPIRCVTQYLKEIAQFHGGSNAVLFNPSDQIISRWLASQN